MRTPLVPAVLWLLLFVLVWEVNRYAYGAVLFAMVEGDRVLGHVGSGWSAAFLLGACFASFFCAGIAQAWCMRSVSGAIPIAMALGSAWVAADVSLRIPWYQLLPSHPTGCDHLVAFVGALCAPVASALGAVTYCTIKAGGKRAADAT